MLLHIVFWQARKYIFSSSSVLPALSLDSVLHLDVKPRSWKGATLYHFVDPLLDKMNPYLATNSVIVMDNTSIHHSLEVQELVEAR